jgi:chromosome partitioning protein
MTRVISAISSKGGAGKTTLAILIAGEWASTGKRVLLIENDEKANLLEWWTRCEQRGNLPENIEIVSAQTASGVEEIIAERGGAFDYVLVDSPGVQSSRIDAIIKLSELVITPIQPNQDEIKAAGQAAEAIGTVSDSDGVDRAHLNVVTRISLPGRALEAYRLIRPFISQLQEAGYSSRLLETELTERNCYREIRNGYGTLQMLEHTDAILKGRREVRSLTGEIDAVLNNQNEEKAVANG